MPKTFYVRRSVDQTCVVVLDDGELGPDPDDWEGAAADKAVSLGIWRDDGGSYGVRAYPEPSTARTTGGA